jgi:hypothetical protein
MLRKCYDPMNLFEYIWAATDVPGIVHSFYWGSHKTPHGDAQRATCWGRGVCRPRA